MLVNINAQVSPSKYVVGSPAAKGFNNDCREFSHVTHVTHAFRAPEILRSKVIGSRLVYDNSTLNTSRIQVVWVSPNHWGNGFRYGTVGLTFDWKALVSRRKAYWVEVAEYSPHACRILLTQTAYPSLTPYDPKVKDGPWWHDTVNDKHYFNGDYCLEFMIDGDIPLAQIDSSTFVSHHSQYCSEHRTAPRDCADLGLSYQEAGSRVVARVVGSGEAGHPLRPAVGHLAGAWGWLKMTLQAGGQGSLKATDRSARPVATSALWLYGTKRDTEAETLLDLFASAQDAETALKESIEASFALPPGTLK